MSAHISTNRPNRASRTRAVLGAAAVVSALAVCGLASPGWATGTSSTSSSSEVKTPPSSDPVDDSSSSSSSTEPETSSSSSSVAESTSSSEAPTSTEKATSTTMKSTTTEETKATTTVESTIARIVTPTPRPSVADVSVTASTVGKASVRDASLTDPGAKLPATGSPTERILVVAAASTLMGGLLLAARRRKPAMVTDYRRPR